MSIRKQLQLGIYKVINPVVRLLIRMGLTPNMVTTIGLVLNIGVAIIFISGAEEGRRGDLSYVGWAGGLILFAGLFDMLDGQVARLGNMSSAFGALYDSVLDRYSELILFLGICYYLVAHHYFMSSLFAFIGLIGSMMVSYTRARAEGLGIECKDGLMQRPERVIIIGVSALACGIASRWMGGNYKISWPNSNFPVFETISIFTIPLTILAFLANATAIGRLRDAKITLKARAAAAKNANATKNANGPTVIIILALSLVAGLPTGAQTAPATAQTAPVTAQTAPVTAPAATSASNPGVLHPRPAVINDPVDTFPIPPTNPNSLFYLQRTPNTNTIICELNEKDGVIDKDEPVKVLWLRYTEQRQRAELNWIQRHFAYGLKEKDLGNGTYELRFVSYKKIAMYLMRSPVDNRHHVYVTIDGRQAILNRVYIRIDPGGTFWSPNVKYLELKGVDVQTGKELIQRVKV
jgi:phosphatidylglycerophosphate synthase